MGPLTKVDTKIALVTLDISRKLNWGKGIVFELIVPDRSQTDNWRTILTLVKGFDRIVDEEKTHGDGSDVIFEVADLTGTFGTLVRTKDAHARVGDSVIKDIYQVAKVSPVAPNEAQVFTVRCKTRTVKTAFDTTKK